MRAVKGRSDFFCVFFFFLGNAEAHLGENSLVCHNFSREVKTFWEVGAVQVFVCLCVSAMRVSLELSFSKTSQRSKLCVLFFFLLQCLVQDHSLPPLPSNPLPLPRPPHPLALHFLFLLPLLFFFFFSSSDFLSITSTQKIHKPSGRVFLLHPGSVSRHVSLSDVANSSPELWKSQSFFFLALCIAALSVDQVQSVIGSDREVAGGVLASLPPGKKHKAPP